MSIRLVAGALVALLVTFGVGWMIGASGRSDVQQSASGYRLRAQAAEAEALLLAARIGLFETNFGDARQRLRGAADRIAEAQRDLREAGEAERAGRLEVVLGETREADRLAGEFSPGAQAAVQRAIDALDAAFAASATPD
jgi:hypothetical protein